MCDCAFITKVGILSKHPPLLPPPPPPPLLGPPPPRTHSLVLSPEGRLVLHDAGMVLHARHGAPCIPTPLAHSLVLGLGGCLVLHDAGVVLHARPLQPVVQRLYLMQECLRGREGAGSGRGGRVLCCR